ncbi:MAG: hypothetical protein J6A69_01020 [Clostridia bacterium]|nr:hypothetical protein [Clostridia bacterium]
MRQQEFNLLLLLLLIGVLLFIYVLYFYFNVFIPFSEERRYLKSEIARTSDREQIHWKKRLRRLYIKSIPVIGRFLAKFFR